MGYTEIFVDVEGVAEETQTFNDEQEEQMDNAIEATKQFARDNSDMLVQIYRLHHPHRKGFDCNCIEYEQDHKPMWSSK